MYMRDRLLLIAEVLYLSIKHIRLYKLFIIRCQFDIVVSAAAFEQLIML